MPRESKQSRKDTARAGLLTWPRGVDAAEQEQPSKPSGLPLFLVALLEMQRAFREASRNPALVEGGLATHPEFLDVERLRVQAWQQFEPHDIARLSVLIDRFEAARAVWART
jgi:hypothetical protein